MHKTLQIPVFLKAKQKNTVNYSIFGGMIAKNASIHSVFAISRKRNTVNSGVLATFGRRNAGIYAVFCPWRRQTPVNYSMFFPFLTDFFALMNETLVLTRFSKNRRS